MSYQIGDTSIDDISSGFGNGYLVGVQCDGMSVRYTLWRLVSWKA